MTINYNIDLNYLYEPSFHDPALGLVTRLSEYPPDGTTERKHKFTFHTNRPEHKLQEWASHNAASKRSSIEGLYAIP
jgi:hypothetical protein